MKIHVAVGLTLLLAASSPLLGQHCAGISDAYLSRIELEKRLEDKDDPLSDDIGLDLNFEFFKRGGRDHHAYQLYVLAYLKSDDTRVPERPPAEILDKKRVVILHTEVIKQTKTFRFPAKVFFDHDTLAKKLAELESLAGARKGDIENADYSRPFRLAIFIPFLDDKKYSTLDGLPEDRHECNYGGDRALLFQPLPYELVIWTPSKDPTVLIHYAAPSTMAREKRD